MSDLSDYDYATDENGVLNQLSGFNDVDISAVLERSNASKKERLAQELEQIRDQLDARDTVHEEIVDELEWKIERYTDRLGTLYASGTGRADGKRERLQNRIEEFYQQLRQERRAHWRDRQELEQERREVRRELDELEDESLSELL